MLTELQQRKLTAVFKGFDSDKNGAIEIADFQRVATQLCHLRGVGPGAAGYEKTVQAFTRGWEGVRQVADTNRDDRITLDEWLAFHAQGPAVFEHVVAGVGGMTFDMIDGNGDGVISQEEYGHMCAAYGLDTSSMSVETLFHHVDANGDGQIDRAEFLQLMREHLQEDQNEANPANYLWGAF